jgi:membrane-bound lytic murein transglycosylase MltF
MVAGIFTAFLMVFFVGYVCYRTGFKVGYSTLEPQIRENAESISSLQCQISSLNDRLIYATGQVDIKAEIIRLSNGRATAMARTWAQQIIEECGNDVPPELVVRLIARESSFFSWAVSAHGAVGLGQLKPTTAKRTAGELLDPSINISEIVRHLRDLRQELHDWGLVLVAYNMGRYAAPVRYAATILGKPGAGD